MKLSEFKQIIREEAKIVLSESKQPINEGLIDSVIGYIVDKLVKKKTKKYFDALAKDPEFLEAKKRVKQSLENFDQTTDRYTKAMADFEKEKEQFAKKYGKQKADKVYNDDKYIYGYKYRPRS